MDSPNRQLHNAADAGDSAGVQAALAAGADPDALLHMASFGTTAAALYFAAGRGHAECVAALLDGGADPNIRSGCDASPLQVAAYFSHEAAVAALLAGGADPALAVNKSLYSAAHVVALNGNVPILRQLLAADPSVALLRNRYRETPLGTAVNQARLEAARCLLEEAPLQPVDEILSILATRRDEWAAPLYAPLTARTTLTADQWARIPTPCPGLGAALPAVLQRSTAEAALLVRHLSHFEQARMCTLALCLHRAATRRPTRRSPRLPALPTPIVWRLLALCPGQG